MDRKSRAPRGDWRKLGPAGGSKMGAAPQTSINGSSARKGPQNGGNPYSGLNMPAYGNGYNTADNYSQKQTLEVPKAQLNQFLSPNGTDANDNNNNNNDQFLSVDNIDKAKVHRRFSVRLNAPPQLDFQHLPLPKNAHGLIQGEKSARVPQLRTDRLPPNGALNSSKYVSIGDMYDDELDALSSRQFDAQRFIKENLSNANSSKIDDFAKTLTKLSLQVDDNIKEVINKSLENLSKTSKDFNETEVEIKNLKATFNELNEIVQSMKETADVRISLEKNNDGSGLRKRDRSSVLVLQKLWDKELQSLFNHVAGALQLLSLVPGRHVLAESGKWNEVNPTTMKLLQSVHLFVLNDHMMILTKRRHTDEASGSDLQAYNRSQTLVATQCWPLRDVRLFDLKTASISNGTNNEDFYMIKIVHQSSKFVYRTERYDHYTKILNLYRRGKDEIRTVMEQDSAMKQNGSVSRTHSQLSRRQSSNKERRSSGILNNSHKRTRSLDLFGNNTIIAMKNLDDNIDELDIQVSRKRYAELIVLLKAIQSELKSLGSGKKTDLQLDEVVQIIENLKMRLHSRKELIIEEMTRRLNAAQKLPNAEVKELVECFKMLDLSHLGRDNLLKSKSTAITNLIDKVEVNGIIPDFISQISIIRFQIVKSTIALYHECFQEDDQSCFLVDWCFQQAKQHVKFLEQQLNGVDTHSVNYLDCIRVTQIQVEDLKKIGIDLTFLFESFFSSVSGV